MLLEERYLHTTDGYYCCCCWLNYNLANINLTALHFNVIKLVSKTASLHQNFLGREKATHWLQFRSCYFLRFLRHLYATLNLCLMNQTYGVIEIESEIITLVASLYGVLDCFCTARDMLVTGPSVMVMLFTSCSVVAFIVSIRLIISFRSILRRSVKNNELSNCSVLNE